MPVPNLLERLFLEERRRLKIIPIAFGEKAVGCTLDQISSTQVP
jgi:hypothetical protein